VPPGDERTERGHDDGRAQGRVVAGAGRSRLRAEHGGGRQDVLLSVDGAHVLGVIYPPASLVGAP
jgi:hypothetical protein